MKSATPMCDMLDEDNDFSAPLPAGFDIEQWKKEVGEGEYEAWCKAFPLFEHPQVEAPTNETYWEFGRIRKRMGLGPDSYNDTQYNLIRATCEYLTAQKGALPELPAVADFLGQGWQAVMAQLESYPPVAPLLAYSQALAKGGSLDSPFRYSEIDSNVRLAQSYVQGCLDFLTKQEQLQQEANQEAERQRQRDELSAQHEHAQRMVKRQELILSVLDRMLIFGLGLAAGWFIAHSG